MSPLFRNPQTENGTNGNNNFLLFHANKKWKQQISVYFLQKEMEKTYVCFPWSANGEG
jgi:hypothetical protein